jgi:hypothetical protein
MSDIVFGTNEQVTVLCDNLLVQGHDLLLDSPARRKPGSPSPFRRALVHHQNDGLTFNFANDYPGGVTIGSVRSLEFIISHRDEILKAGGNPPDEKLDLADVIKSLRQQIADLQAQVAKLTRREPLGHGIRTGGR